MNKISMKLCGVEKEVEMLDDMLNGLTSYGKPRLSHMGEGWYCTIDMFVSSVGAEFKIASEFSHKTHKEAVRECCERVIQTLEDLGVG